MTEVTHRFFSISLPLKLASDNTQKLSPISKLNRGIPYRHSTMKTTNRANLGALIEQQLDYLLVTFV